MQMVVVCYRKTSTGECDCTLEYDGGRNSVMNLKNSTLVHYGILLSYLAQFAMSGLLLDTFHQANMMAAGFCIEWSDHSIGQKPLQQAWNAFTVLLDREP
uniref:Uncharacterized protein n=1 Tax=Plectus sambesii TaxID=2011161 RepID=A0A914X0I6_9BILA